MRIGLHLPQFREAVDAGLVREVATVAEEAGIDDLWVSDHVILPVGSTRPPESFHDALTVLAFAAATTGRIGLGTSVMVAPYRHPVVLARAVATLDALAGGRVVLGVASGWLASEFAALGVPFGRRGALTDETIDVCRALWSGAADFAGPTVHLDGMRLAPGPGRAGGPPIWIGGNSPAGIRRAVARGDAWHTTISDPDELARRLEGLRAECAAAARPPEGLPVSVRVRAGADRVAALTPRLAALGVTHVLVDLPGTDPGRFAAETPALRAAGDAA